MGDVTDVFRELQKHCQKENIILPDILKYKDLAIEKLQLMQVDTYPGRHEVAYPYQKDGKVPISTERNVHNTLVTTNRREPKVIRNEIIQ